MLTFNRRAESLFDVISDRFTESFIMIGLVRYNGVVLGELLSSSFHRFLLKTSKLNLPF